MDLNERTHQRIFALRKPDALGSSIEVEEIWYNNCLEDKYNLVFRECMIRKELKEAAKLARKAVGEDAEQPNNADDMSKNIHAFFNDLGNEKGPIDPVNIFMNIMHNKSFIAPSLLWREVRPTLTPCPIRK
jgi:hypothetical protein